VIAYKRGKNGALIKWVSAAKCFFFVGDEVFTKTVCLTTEAKNNLENVKIILATQS